MDDTILPPLIWSGVISTMIGSLITFIGVSLQLSATARENEKTRRAQLEAKDLELKMQLRRDVFLQAVDGLAGSQQYFAAFADPGNSLEQLRQLSPSHSWGNRLHVVASLETVQAFSRAQSVLGAATFDLLQMRFAVSDLDSEVDDTRRRIDWIGSFQQQIQANLNSAISRGDRAEIEMQGRAFTTAMEATSIEADNLRKKLTELVDRRLDLHHSLIDRAIEHATVSQPIVAVALLAVRKEIGIEIDAQEYTNFITTTAESFRIQVGTYMSDLVRRLKGDEQSPAVDVTDQTPTANG